MERRRGAHIWFVLLRITERRLIRSHPEPRKAAYLRTDCSQQVENDGSSSIYRHGLLPLSVGRKWVQALPRRTLPQRATRTIRERQRHQCTERAHAGRKARPREMIVLLEKSARHMTPRPYKKVLQKFGKDSRETRSYNAAQRRRSNSSNGR